MTHADDLAYLTDTLKRLDALRERAINEQDDHLAKLGADAADAIGILVGCLLADSSGDPLTTKDDQAAKVDRFRQRMAARIAEIQGALMTWLRPRDGEADSVCITLALLDTALDRHVAVHGADGFELIEAAYHRALKRWRGRLQ